MPYYIEDLIELSVDVEIDLGLNLRIRVATTEEQAIIKSLISGFGYSPRLEVACYRFHEYSIKKRLPEGGVELKKRNEKDFRYFVLEEIEKTGQYNQAYAKALLLTDKEFFIPFGFARMTNPEGGISIKYSFDSELSANTYFNDKNIVMVERKPEFPKDFTDDDKDQASNNLVLLNDFDKIKENYPYVNKALDDFFKISEISNHSVFKIVTYFACLELLLVDTNFDKLKSIRLQLESKLDLLNNRIDEPVLVSDYIKGPDTLTLGKIIGIAYNYRSSIAHGDFVDFEKKLQIFSKTSTMDILIFLRTVLKRIIIFALKEPQLITDLKKC